MPIVWDGSHPPHSGPFRSDSCPRGCLSWCSWRNFTFVALSSCCPPAFLCPHVYHTHYLIVLPHLTSPQLVGSAGVLSHTLLACILPTDLTLTQLFDPCIYRGPRGYLDAHSQPPFFLDSPFICHCYCNAFPPVLSFFLFLIRLI